MKTGDPKSLLPLAGWALGFLSGIAQGTGKDILRNADDQQVMARLYSDCSKEPSLAMSVALERLAQTLVSR